ncbi:MAG: hypothetical protein ACRC4T_08325 [Cetobacterium sp.]
MFTGIKLRNVPIEIKNKHMWSYKKLGERLSNEIDNDFKYELKKYLKSSSNITSNELTDLLFPKIEKFDIFLSHSHKDLDKALGLAGFLKANFGLEVFIDSCFWRNINELLKEIDNEFSKSDYDSELYDYNKRNISTAHCHIILATALKEMIDHIECFIFLDTNESISLRSQMEETKSCWIYYELEISKCIEKKIPLRFFNENLYAEFSYESILSKSNLNKKLEINYTTNISHLEEKDFNILYNTSINNFNPDYRGYNKLDLLYKALNLKNPIFYKGGNNG